MPELGPPLELEQQRPPQPAVAVATNAVVELVVERAADSDEQLEFVGSAAASCPSAAGALPAFVVGFAPVKEAAAAAAVGWELVGAAMIVVVVVAADIVEAVVSIVGIAADSLAVAELVGATVRPENQRLILILLRHAAHDTDETHQSWTVSTIRLRTKHNNAPIR